MIQPQNPNSARAIAAAQSALSANPVYIDTETTGLEKNDEIVEISIVTSNGQVAFSSLVRPSRPIPPSAIAIHKITNDMVRTAPLWPNIWNSIRPILENKLVAIYNSEFDIRMITQSFAAYKQSWQRSFKEFDIMKTYSDFRAEWDSRRMSYRIFRLEEAGKFFNISIPNAHRSEADTLLARAVLLSIAGIPY